MKFKIVGPILIVTGVLLLFLGGLIPLTTHPGPALKNEIIGTLAGFGCIGVGAGFYMIELVKERVSTMLDSIVIMTLFGAGGASSVCALIIKFFN
jgi:fumarate reductase subunit D